MVQVDTLGSSFDTYLAIWTGSVVTALTLIAGNDRYLGGPQSAVFASLSSGVTYQIAVYGSWITDRGDIRLTVTNDMTGSIAGAVTGPDALTPLPGIFVTIHRWTGVDETGVHWTESDENGSYIARGLPADTYRVMFHDYSSNSNYLPEVYNDAPDIPSGADVVVSATATTANINASLAAASSISGRITGPDGLPLANWIRAAAYRRNASGRWDQVNAGYAVDDGIYIIRGLSACTCRVRFTVLNTDDYIDEVYADVADLDSGTDIIVPGASTVTGINASVALASKISGRVTGPDDLTSLPGIHAAAYAWNGADWMQSEWIATDSVGGYSVGRLRAGTYRVQFRDPLGRYTSEVYKDAADLRSGLDIIVPALTTITGVVASLAEAPPLELSSPPVLVGVLQTGTNRFDIQYTGAVGRDHVLQEFTAPLNEWADIGAAAACVEGTNALPRPSSSSQVLWRLRMLP
jgi:hypothetical protein